MIDGMMTMEEAIADTINARILRNLYYNGCWHAGNMSEWRKWRRFKHWERKAERYREKLRLPHTIVHGHGDFQNYFEEYSWKPCNWLDDIRLFISRCLFRYTRHLESKLKDFKSKKI